MTEPEVARAHFASDVGVDLSFAVEDLRASRRRVPLAPGVYTFVDGGGRPLYVGKSVRLRERLGHYVQPATALKAGKTARLMRLARRVRIELCGSELAALLREAHLVQELRPPFNRRMAKPEGYTYIRIDYAHDFPRVAVVDRLDDEGRFLGPFFQRRKVDRVLEALNDAFALRTCDPMPVAESCWREQVQRCLAPCVDKVGAGKYGRNLLIVRESLAGRGGAAIRRLESKRDELAADERFEAAAMQQRRIEALCRLRATLYASQAEADDAIVVQPAVTSGVVQLWGVRGGALCDSGFADVDNLAVLFERLWRSLQGARLLGEPMPKSELDQRCILHRWLRSPVAASRSVRLRGASRAAVWKCVDAMAREMRGAVL